MADVLVVDDDDDLAELVALVIESCGHTVRRAADGRDGLRMLRQRLPDLVVLDVEMPHLTGPEMAYQMLLHDAGEEQVPILLMSGAADLTEIAGGVGTPYVLGKPSSAEALTGAVERALRERCAPRPS